MSSFTDPLTLTHMDVNWKVWRLERDFTYEIGDKESGRKITVPKGFYTDGASIPRFLWAVLPAWGSYSRAALVHDFLCHNINKGHPHPEAPTRRKADLVFWEAMKVCGTRLPIRMVMYAGVRLGSFKWPWTKTNIVSRVNP